METFGIGVIARRAGVAASTIRYYERIGLLPPSVRQSGKRRYNAAILQELALIRMAQQAGFSIAEIQALLHDFPAHTPPAQRWQALSRSKLQDIERQIERAQSIKALLQNTLLCQCAELTDCASGIQGIACTQP